MVDLKFLSLLVHGISCGQSHGLSPRLGLASAFGSLRLRLGFCKALLRPSWAKPSLHITTPNDLSNLNDLELKVKQGVKPPLVSGDHDLNSPLLLFAIMLVTLPFWTQIKNLRTHCC